MVALVENSKIAGMTDIHQLKFDKINFKLLEFSVLVEYHSKLDPLGMGLWCYNELIRTRQIIRYRATATLRRPQNKQYSASK